MRALNLYAVQEYKWTAEELRDPAVQKIALTGKRRWQCTECKKIEYAQTKPKGCVHYYTYSTKARFHLGR